LLPLKLTNEYIDSIKVPKLPEEIVQELKKNYNLNSYDISVLLFSNLINFFELTMKNNPNRNNRLVLNWLTSDLLGYLNKNNLSINFTPITPELFGELIDEIEKQTISTKTAKMILEMMFYGDKRKPIDIITSDNLFQINDKELIEKHCKTVVIENQNDVNKYLQGNERIFGYLVSKVLKLTNDKGNPQLISEILKKVVK
jgi:aspartyl-tRNA(Asn)/glutamyl-tRNA(Gln) amidotransferase subunit B